MTVERDAVQGRGSVADRGAHFRYGTVFLLTLAVAVFVIVAPTANWSRAVGLAIEGAALVIALATSRGREEVRYRRAALVVGAVMIVVVVAVAAGVSHEFTAVVALLVTVAVPVTIYRGALRLLRERGVTIETVAGGLAIYLSIGLMFAWIIAFIAEVGSTPYFAQHTSGTEGDRVYYSFTVLTTTGFGDFSPAAPVGHAIAVIEMLTGQLYLVTIIGLLIGHFVSKRPGVDT